MGAWRIAPAPKFAGQREWTCVECGHEDLKRPVFLHNGDALISVGTGCAAVLLFGRKDDRLARRVRAEADAIEARETALAADRAEKRARYALALANFQAAMHSDTQGVVDAEARAAVESCRRTYVSMRQRDGLALTLPEFLARVAETGELAEFVAAA